MGGTAGQKRRPLEKLSRCAEYLWLAAEVRVPEGGLGTIQNHADLVRRGLKGTCDTCLPAFSPGRTLWLPSLCLVLNGHGLLPTSGQPSPAY